MATYNPVTYKGPNTEYKPPIGTFSGPTDGISNRPAPNGYHDLPYLKEKLDAIINDSNDIYATAESILSKYSLIIDNNDTTMINAQATAYPGSIPPNYISIDEYNYLILNNNSSASQYLITAYENSVRGISGCNALDIAKIILTINREAKRIKEFIDGYIGDLDDTSEYRTVELFQDWAQDASNHIQKFRTAIKGQIAARLPQSELDQLDSEKATQFQALLQVKLNVVNKTIADLFSQIIKNWDEVGQIFYDRNLGPGLKFQLKVGRNLRSQMDKTTMPTIAAEVNASVASLDNNFNVALADQIKRNKMFNDNISLLLVNIGQRDTYVSYIAQLSQLGKLPKKIFTTKSNDVDVIYNSSRAIDNTGTSDSTNNFAPDHSALSGSEDDNAHPQYLLRAGGESSIITGNIEMAENVRIGGIIPSLHKHNGIDGSAKISGLDIEYDTITVANIDNATGDTSIPTDIVVVSQVPLVNGSGITSVTVQITFNMEDPNTAGYEFEITEL